MREEGSRLFFEHFFRRFARSFSNSLASSGLSSRENAARMPANLLPSPVPRLEWSDALCSITEFLFALSAGNGTRERRLVLHRRGRGHVRKRRSIVIRGSD